MNSYSTAPQPAVKPLEWEHREGDKENYERWQAFCLLGTYWIFNTPEGYDWFLAGHSGGKACATEALAKAAAQADYEARIMSALTTPPAQVEPFGVRRTADCRYPKCMASATGVCNGPCAVASSPTPPAQAEPVAYFDPKEVSWLIEHRDYQKDHEDIVDVVSITAAIKPLGKMTRPLYASPTPPADLKAENERLREHIQELIDASGQQCACGYDKPDDVCLGHTPLFNRLKARATAAEAENKRLREAATSVIDFHDGPAEHKRPDVFSKRIAALRTALRGGA